jgi:hypothetical protein
MGYLLDYFDEPTDSDCGRCDNCRAAQEAAEATLADSDFALPDGGAKRSAPSFGISAGVAANS